MYGKHFEGMYEGSMVGAGLNVFAVWGYCIAKNRCGFVELNPKLLAFVLGGSEKDITAAIGFLCEKDGESRSHDEDGRRLVKEGEYQYRLVNWGKYDSMKNAVDQREYNRMKQREYRARKGPKVKGPGKNAGLPLPGETAYVAAVERGEKPVDPGAVAVAQVAERKGSWGEVVGVGGNGV